MRKFAVCIEWNYRGSPEERLEKCTIYPATQEDEERDGDNCITGKGVDGYRFDIYSSLEDAILNAGFNPFHIQYEGLTEEETNDKDKMLSSYTWSYEHGLQKKV